MFFLFIYPSLTLAVESIETRSTGVTVVTSETRFTDAGLSPGIRPARVIHSTCCAAFTVCTENRNKFARFDDLTFIHVCFFESYLMCDRVDNSLGSSLQ